MIRLLFAIAMAALAASTGNTQPSSLKGFQDEGTFGLYVNEERVGTLTFKWSDDGSLTNEAVLAAAGQTATTVDTVTVDAEGRWTRLETKSAQGTVTTVREGDVARRTFKDKTDIIDLKPGSVLFSNYGPALMAGIVRQYDNAKGGKQPLAVIVLPGASLDGSLEFKEKVDRSAAGTDLALEHYLFELRGIEIHLYTDATGKVYLADVPQQRAAYVRDGFEACARPLTPIRSSRSRTSRSSPSSRWFRCAMVSASRRPSGVPDWTAPLPSL